MATQISDIVSVEITKANAAAAAAATLGIPVIIGEDSRTTSRCTKYASAKDMLSAGYKETDALYLAALALTSKYALPNGSYAKSCEYFYIGSCHTSASNAKFDVEFDGNATAGTFTITVTKTDTAETTASISYDATAEEIATAIESLSTVSGATVVGLATSGGFTIEFTDGDATVDFASVSVTESLTGVDDVTVTKLTVGSESEELSDALTELFDSYAKNFFFITSTYRELSNLKTIATAVSELRKMAFLCSIDSNNLTATSGCFGDWLKNKAYPNVAWMYTSESDEYPDMVFIGHFGWMEPGKTNWLLRHLSTEITYLDLTATQISNLKSLYATFPEEIGGVGVTNGAGKTASGEWSDTIHGFYWLEARISEAVYNLLITVDKVPFTNDGITQVESVMKPVLDLAESNNLLASYEITVPDASDITSAVKATRVLPDVGFTGELAGAVNSVSITGTISD